MCSPARCIKLMCHHSTSLHFPGVSSWLGGYFPVVTVGVTTSIPMLQDVNVALIFHVLREHATAARVFSMLEATAARVFSFQWGNRGEAT